MSDLTKESVLIFGAGRGAHEIFRRVSERYNVLGFLDDDQRKWGSDFLGHSVLDPSRALEDQRFDRVVISAVHRRDQMVARCAEIGVPNEKIVTSYVDAPIESRRVFLESFSKMIYKYGDDGSVAEAGVFQGDFAFWINRYFPDRTLHLFDTFSGFDPKDIAADKRYSSVFAKGDCSNTSEQFVLSRMEHPEMCEVHKGYFPDTWGGGMDSKRFCFVNLDMDLYEPTYSGLSKFFGRLTDHGVILVHDYFAEAFSGAREAVDRFISEQRGHARAIPIGDTYSVMVIHF